MTLLLAAASCTSSSDQPPGSSAPRNPGSSPSPSASGVTVISQDFDNGLPCPVTTDPTLPPGSGCVTEVRADLDGNGTADRFVVFARLDAGGLPLDWRAVAVPSAGRPTPAVAVPTGQGVLSVYPRVIGAADANGDGRAEVFVKLSAIIYHVGGQQIEGMFGLAGGRIRWVTLAGRGPLVFRAGGISRYGDGALCTNRDGHRVFVLRHVEQIQPAFWEWTERIFAWRGLSLREISRRRGHLPLTLHITDPQIDPFYHLQCGPVRTV